MIGLRRPDVRHEHAARRCQFAPSDPARLTRVIRVSASPTEGEPGLRARLRAGLERLGVEDELHALGKRWLLMGNFNSPDAYPASSDLALVKAAARLFREAGCNITLGAGAGIPWLPTMDVIRELGVDTMAQRPDHGLVGGEELCYVKDLDRAVNEDREGHGKPPLPPKVPRPRESETRVSTTEPESGFMVRDGKPRGFFYLDHRTVDGRWGIITDTHVTAGNVHWQYNYDADRAVYRCKAGHELRYYTTNREGYREYRSDPSICCQCPLLDQCTHSQVPDARAQ